MTSEIKVDTISEQTSANGVTIDGLTIKDGNIIGDVALAGTTPTFTIGDAGAEDASLIFDGNAVDYYMALDDSADNLIIGSGSTVGSNSLITIDSDGDFTLDSAADITLDVGGGDISLKGSGAEYGKFNLSGNSLNIHSSISDGDIVFKGSDGGSTVTALTLDMSAAGYATFNSGATFGGNVLLADIIASGSGGIALQTDEGTKRIIIEDDGDVIINETSTSSDFRVESNGNANMLVVDGGDDDVRIGTGTTFGNNYAGLKLNGGLTVGQFSGDSLGGNIMFVKSRNTTIGSQTIVADDDEIGRVSFKADDGDDSNYNNNVAAIVCQIDAAPGTNDTAGRLMFETAADGARVNTERMRITSSGKVGIGTSSPSELLEIANTSGDPGLRLNGAASGNPLIDFAQNGTQKAYFQYLDSGDAFTYQSDGTHTFQAGGSTEYFRISTAFSGPVSGKFSTFGESAPDCGDGGMTLQQGSNDDNILTLKSSDIAHGRTSVAETDTYAEFHKAGINDGGLQITTLNDLGNIAFYLDAHARSNDTGKGTGDHGCMNFDANTHDGSGGGTALSTNANMVTFSNDNSVRFIFDAEGDIHVDGSSSISTYDAYEDAQLIRAYDLSHGAGVIASQFDKFVQYNKEDLTDAGLVGRVNNETLKDGTEAKPLINMTGFVRLHNGAIWQQYEKHQRLASAFYKLAEKTIGKEEADKLLTEEEIQLLN